MVAPYIIDAVRKTLCIAVQQSRSRVVYCRLRAVKQVPGNDQYIRFFLHNCIQKALQGTDRNECP